MRIKKVKIKPMYFCLDRQTAENFLCNNILKVPTCSKEYVVVFRSKKGAINSMKLEAKEALKNNDSFRFMVFGFYFSEISPIWVDEQEYKGNNKKDMLFDNGKVLINDMYKAKNCISIQDLFLAESWCFYKDKNKKLRYRKDYRIVEMDLNDDLTIKREI